MGTIHYNEPFKDNYIPNIFKELYLDKVYEPYLQGQTDLTIIDAGANIGLATKYFAQFAKQVYSIEPSAKTQEVFNKNTEDLTNITLIQAAISGKPGEMTFHHNTNTTMNSLSPEVEDGSQAEEKVKVTTLEEIINENNIEKIDLLKLDVEGEEANVICSDSFRRIADKIEVMVFEYHSWCNRNPDQLRTALRDMGFDWAQIPCDATVFVCTRIK